MYHSLSHSFMMDVGLFPYFFLIVCSSVVTPVHVSLCIFVRGFLQQGVSNFLSVKTNTEMNCCIACCSKQVRSKWQGLWLTQPSCFFGLPVMSCHIILAEKFSSRTLSHRLFNIFMNQLLVLLNYRFGFCRSGLRLCVSDKYLGSTDALINKALVLSYLVQQPLATHGC